MGRGKAKDWTKQEIDFLMRNYHPDLLEDIAFGLNRPVAGIRCKYYKELKKQQIERIPQNKCPICGRESQNEIESIKGRTLINAYWCKNCEIEFYEGEALPFIETSRKGAL